MPALASLDGPNLLPPAGEPPLITKAFYFLAEAYGHYGDTEHAIEKCRKALELKPDFDEAAALLKKLELNDTHE